MAHIKRKFIDKHWSIFIVRGLVALAFSFVTIFGLFDNFEATIAWIAVFLLFMGIIDSVSALYASLKKRGWFNSIIDAIIDVVTSMLLLFFARGDITTSVVILAVYTAASGVIDICHSFVSTVDPTDRFIRALTGIIGVLIGFVILNAGEFELMTFVRFFGAYILVVGVTSLIYGVHNRAEENEDKIARREALSSRKKSAKKSRKTSRK